MTGQHAPLAPSSAARWVQCPGSRAMCEAYPQREDDPKAIEGTLAHMVAAAYLQDTFPMGDYSDEMLDGAEMWVDAVGKSPIMHIEEQVDCSVIHDECYGTPDYWCNDVGHIQVWDYKFGHRHVEVFENWQLLCYMAGILDSLGIDGVADQHLRVTMGIVQPRSYHRDGPVRTWSCMASDLRGYFNRLKMAADAAMAPDAPCNTGPECLDCSARHACPTLQKASYAAMEFSGANIPFNLPPEAISLELFLVREAIATLKARESGLDAEVLGRIKQGTVVPGWMTEQGQGRKKWVRPVEEIVALGEMMGVNVGKPAVLTPAQAIKAGLPAELIESYTEVPKGEIKLVQSNDKLRRVFSKGA